MSTRNDATRWTILTLAVLLVLPGAAIAHDPNPVDVFDLGRTLGKAGDGSPSADAQFCDQLYKDVPSEQLKYFCAEENSNTQSDQIDEGFAFSTDQTVHLPFHCDFEIRNPTSPVGPWNTTVDHETENDVTLCKDKSFSKGASFEGTDVHTSESFFVQTGESDIKVRDLNAKYEGSVQDDTSYVVTTVAGDDKSPADSHIHDVSKEDRYWDIVSNATTYYLDDPTGDDVLTDDGLKISLDLGETYTTDGLEYTKHDRDLFLTTTSSTSSTSDGYIWEVTSSDGTPISVTMTETSTEYRWDSATYSG